MYKARLFIIIISSVISTASVNAQKKLIENSDWYLINWKRLLDGATAISSKGKVVCYSYVDSGFSSSLVVHYLKTQTSDTIYNFGGQVTFTNDERFLFYKEGSRLVKYNLQNKTLDHQLNVSQWKLLDTKFGEYLITTAENGRLQIKNIKDNRAVAIDSVIQYIYDEVSLTIAVVTKNSIHLVSLPHLQKSQIFKGATASGVSFDASGRKLSFFSNGPLKSFWIFDRNDNSIKKLLDEHSPQIPQGYLFGGMSTQFTPDGKNVIFIFQKQKSEPNKIRMEIWNYSQLFDGELDDRAIAIMTIDNSSSLKVIASGYVELLKTVSQNDSKGEIKNFVIFARRFEFRDKIYYQLDKVSDFQIYSVEDSSFRAIVPKKHLVRSQNLSISPEGKYACWWDLNTNDFYTYSIQSHSITNITKTIKLPNDIRLQNDGSVPHRIQLVNVKWLENDGGLIATDKFDLWQIDPSGVYLPINLTGAYGRSHEIKFNIVDEDLQGRRLKDGVRVILTAFDIKSKRNGYASLVIGSGNGLRLGRLNDMLFADPISGTKASLESDFKKAKLTDDYLVVGQTASDSPNLYHTKDFKTFEKISDIHPEKEYNWLTSELISYPMQGGKTGQAILYKPEDFDPKKKYPVIFTYYQDRSGALHEYHLPGAEVNINIPTYVSNGYLVVIPDIINDAPGGIVQTTLNSVVSAVDYLKKYPWFDSSKMGLQGQSFGGYETNILIANTRLFAAAQASDAPSNVAVFGQFFKHGSMTLAERGQANLNTTLWKDPELYIKSSPLFQADKITTPLLLTHGRSDVAVDFNQGESLYYALTRLLKPVWLVIYEGGGHAEFGSQEGKTDFNVRRKQFFDHYLKNAPMPMWMKGRTLSLELDTIQTN